MKKSSPFVKARDASRRPIRGLYIRGKTYYARITENGDRGWHKLEVETVDKAKVEMSKIRQNLKLGLPISKKKPEIYTFEDYATKVYLEKIPALKKWRTVRNEKKQLEGILIPYFGKYRIDMISKQQVEQFRVTRRNQTSHRKTKVSAHTVNHNVIVLRNVLKSAADDGLIEKSVANEVKPLKVVVPKKRFVSLNEVLDVAGWIKEKVRHGKRISYAIRFLAAFGLRFSEGMLMKWPDVDWLIKNICVGADGDTKNSSCRYIPFIMPEAEALLKEMYEDATDKKGWLFPSYRNPNDTEVKPMADFTASLNAAIKALGQAHWSPHDLRHHFGSRLAMAGVDFKTIGDLFGHKDGGRLAAMTYSHLAPDHLKSQMAKLLPPPNVVPFDNKGQVTDEKVKEVAV